MPLTKTKNKYFINFIHGYFKSLTGFSLVENYHLHTFVSAKEAGYNHFVAIVNGGSEILKNDPNLKILEENYGIQIKIIEFKNIFQLLGLLLKYAQIAFHNKALIYFNSHHQLTYLGAVLTKIFSLGRIKTIFMAHTQPLRGGLGFGKLKQFFQDKILFKFFIDRIRLNNPTEEKFLLSKKVNAKKLWVVPLVVDDHVFHRINDYDKRKDLLYFGQLSKKKNITNILQAFKLVVNNEKHRALKLHIVGKEAGDYSLDKDLQELDLTEKVVRYGFLKQGAELNNLLNQTLIYLNDSHDEGQCLTVFEVSLAGNALALPEIMSFTEVFREGALFHRVGDYKKLATDIIQYLEHPELIKDNNERVIQMIKTEYTETVIKTKLRELLIF